MITVSRTVRPRLNRRSSSADCAMNAFVKDADRSLIAATSVRPTKSLVCLPHVADLRVAVFELAEDLSNDARLTAAFFHQNEEQALEDHGEAPREVRSSGHMIGPPLMNSSIMKLLAPRS